MDELEQRKKFRNNPLTGTFHALPGYYDPLHGLGQFRPDHSPPQIDFQRKKSLEFLDLSEFHQIERPRVDSDSAARALKRLQSDSSTLCQQIPAFQRSRCNSVPLDGEFPYQKATESDKTEDLLDSISSADLRQSFQRESSDSSISSDGSERSGGKPRAQEDNSSTGYVSTGKGLYRKWKGSSRKRRQVQPPAADDVDDQRDSLEYCQKAPNLPVNPFMARRLLDDDQLRVMAIDRAVPRRIDDPALHCSDSDDEIDSEVVPKPYFIHEEAVTEHYLVVGEDQLGDGSYAVVRPAVRRDNKTQVAIKQVHKNYLRTAEAKKALEREVEIHLRLKHRHIVQLYEVYETEDFLYLVMAKAKWGTLKSYLTINRILPEVLAGRLAQQLLRGVFHMHEHGILHCDLKPDNLLLTDAKGESNKKAESGIGLEIRNCDLQVCDFGLAMKVPDVRYYKYTGDVHKVPNTGVIGTSGYISPEIMNGLPYGKPADMWSVGIIIYEMLAGYTPFYPPSACVSEKVDFSDYVWKRISPAARELVGSLLRKDPSKRLTAAQALAHPFFENAAVTL